MLKNKFIDGLWVVVMKIKFLRNNDLVYKLTISLLFGVTGFLINFIPIDIYKSNGMNVSILPGLIFPLMISIAWGWKWGLISALFGGCQTMWFLWSSDGYGMLYSVPILTLWIFWHGLFSDLRKNRKTSDWYLSKYIIELPFRIVFEIGYFTLFKWLVSGNPPFWDISITNTTVIQNWIHIRMIKSFISAYAFLLLTDLAFTLKPIRRFFKIDTREKSGGAIILLSFLGGAVICITDAVAHGSNGSSLYQRLFFDLTAIEMIQRLSVFVVLVVFGLFISSYYNKISKQKQEIYNSYMQAAESKMTLYKTKEWLDRNEKMLKTYLDKAPYGIMVVDKDGVILDFNNRACEISGYIHNDLDMMLIANLIMNDDRLAINEHLSDIVESGGGTIDVRLVTKNEQIRHIWLKSVKLIDNKYLIYIEDITDLRFSEQKIEYLKYHDYLTGLYNRRYFDEICKGLNIVENLPISIVMSDLNGLRIVNETLGHAAGDNLIKRAASVIKSLCNNKNIAARWGGDEFIVLMLKTDPTEAERFIDNIHRECRCANTENSTVSLSLGYYTEQSIEDIKLVIKNAENALYEQKALEQPSIMNLSTQTIIKTLYEKNIREEEHSKRVSYLCTKIGKAMGLSERKVKELESVGLLHDIGKIILDDDILDKTSTLLPDEWKQIKRHPEVGYRIMNGLNGMNTLASIIYSHHERYDGFGYPRGLKGEEIPLEARVLAIADSYDAMTSARPYRKAMDKYYAIKEIIDNSGKQFDESIAQVFVEKVLGEKWNLFDNDILDSNKIKV